MAVKCYCQRRNLFDVQRKLEARPFVLISSRKVDICLMVEYTVGFICHNKINPIPIRVEDQKKWLLFSKKQETQVQFRKFNSLCVMKVYKQRYL